MVLVTEHVIALADAEPESGRTSGGPWHPNWDVAVAVSRAVPSNS